MDVTGTWYNELGSQMTINQVSQGGFTGSYQTAVSANGCIQAGEVFALVGQTDTDSGGEGIAFVVCWLTNNPSCNSITAWCGRAQTINGVDQLITFWLLTTEPTSDQDWAATTIGQDIFTPNPPSEASIAAKSKVLRHPHP